MGSTYGSWSLLPTVSTRNLPLSCSDFWRTGRAAVCSVHACYQRFLQIFQSVESAARDRSKWHVEALKLNPVALKFLSWMISHAARHLMLVLSLQIVLELGPITNCKFCPCPRLVCDTYHTIDIIAADFFFLFETTHCWRSNPLCNELDSIVWISWRPYEFEWNLVISRLYRIKARTETSRCPPAQASLTSICPGEPVVLTSCSLPQMSPADAGA